MPPFGSSFKNIAFKNFVATYGEKALEAVVERLQPFAEECAREKPTQQQIKLRAWEILRDVLNNFYDPAVVDSAVEPFRPE